MHTVNGLTIYTHTEKRNCIFLLCLRYQSSKNATLSTSLACHQLINNMYCCHRQYTNHICKLPDIDTMRSYNLKIAQRDYITDNRFWKPAEHVSGALSSLINYKVLS